MPGTGTSLQLYLGLQRKLEKKPRELQTGSTPLFTVVSTPNFKPVLKLSGSLFLHSLSSLPSVGFFFASNLKKSVTPPGPPPPPPLLWLSKDAEGLGPCPLVLFSS